MLPPQRFREGVHNLKGKFVKPLPHVVQLDCILLVNSLEATRTAIVDGVAEILVVFHKLNSLVCGRGACKLPLLGYSFHHSATSERFRFLFSKNSFRVLQYVFML